MIICELGGGFGRNIEVMARLLPKTTFLYFDIPPQLYLANQYLKSIFDKRVIEYGEDTKDYLGKIIILPTWKMPEWSKTKIDVFWNSASFQEMEPDVVKNYLSLVKEMKAEWIYINALPTGNYTEGTHCTTKLPVRDSLYRDELKEQYECKTVYTTDYFLESPRYKSYIFKRI